MPVSCSRPPLSVLHITPADIGSQCLRSQRNVTKANVGENSERPIDSGQEPGDGRLAGARIAGKHQVERQRLVVQFALPPELPGTQQIGIERKSRFTGSSPMRLISSALISSKVSVFVASRAAITLLS